MPGREALSYHFAKPIPTGLNPQAREKFPLPRRYAFSPLLGAGEGGAGVTGLQTVAVLGAPAGLISVFFGFFFSRPLLSRLPIVLSSH
jgi:hypothetical protein